VYLAQFQKAGRELAEGGLITGASGNLSMRLKERLLITRHDSLLSALSSADLVETSIHADNSATPLASWELPVHRAIYLRTSAYAVAHAHPPCAVTLSLVEGEIEYPCGVTVVGTGGDIMAGVLATEIAGELKKYPLVMVRGHGSFAIGRTLAEACELTGNFEMKCARLCRERSIPLLEAGE
jgi:L-fuculose-phosphate aldolase